MTNSEQAVIAAEEAVAAMRIARGLEGLGAPHVVLSEQWHDAQVLTVRALRLALKVQDEFEREPGVAAGSESSGDRMAAKGGL